MKTFRIHEFGAPSNAALQDVNPIETGNGQVTIRVEAASVNPLDLKILAGYMQAVFPVAMPYTLGTDVAGVVEAVDSQVTTVHVGDRVVGRLEPTAGGAFSQSAVIAASALCAIPVDMSYEQAAALPTAAGSAWLALFGVGKLREGQRVLVHAGAGGVGTFAVQFAKRAGAYVIATASTKNHALVKELGADEVVDYRHEDFANLIKNLDLVIDTIGGETLERSWQMLKPGGTLASLADHTIESRGGVNGAFVFFNHDAEILDKILDTFAARKLQVILDTIHPLEDTRAALEQVASGHARGKVIVRASS
jgi:NADPH:quinone reductase-like Zn-dependent oxidoreductase